MKILIKNSNKTPRTETAGFSLVENFVALSIVAIMLTSLYGSFASGFATIRVSRESLRATQILMTKLEGARLCTFDQLTNTVYNPATFTESFDPKDQAAGAGGIVYNGTFTPSIPASGSLPEAYRTNMLLITVSLNWTMGKVPHTRTMQTYAARDGMAGYVSIGR